MITLQEAKKSRPLKNLTWNMKITGWLSPYFIYILANLNINPNLVTFSWIIVSWIGLYFISLGSYVNSVLGILIFHFALFLDSLDGGLARVLKKTNVSGEFLDRFFSTLNRSLMLLVLGIGLYRASHNAVFLYLGIFSSIFLALENLIKMKKYESLINSNRLDIIKKNIAEKKNIRKGVRFYIYEAFRPANHFTLSFFAVIFSFTWLYLYLYSILVFFEVFILLFKTIFELKNIKQF